MTPRIDRIVSARDKIDDAFRRLIAAQKKCDQCTARRSQMQAGVDSRARMTTMAARWSTACEERDRCEQALRDLGVDLGVAVRS